MQHIARDPELDPRTARTSWHSLDDVTGAGFALAIRDLAILNKLTAEYTRVGDMVTVSVHCSDRQWWALLDETRAPD
jgi:hypothetical protein